MASDAGHQAQPAGLKHRATVSNEPSTKLLGAEMGTTTGASPLDGLNWDDMIDKTFEMFDENQDGQVSEMEMATFLSQIGKPVAQPELDAFMESIFRPTTNAPPSRPSGILGSISPHSNKLQRLITKRLYPRAGQFSSPGSPFSSAPLRKPSGSSKAKPRKSFLFGGTVVEFHKTTFAEKLHNFSKLPNTASEIWQKIDNIEADPFVVAPDVWWRSLWDFCTMSLVLYVSVMQPIRLGFAHEATGSIAHFELSIDFIFLADLILNFRTGYLKLDGVVEMKAVAIATNYIRGYFFIDLLSSLPWDLIAVDDGESDSPVFIVLPMLKMCRLMRLARVYRKLDVLKQSGVVEREHISIVTAVLLLLGTAHIMACFWAFCATSSADVHVDSWFASRGIVDGSISLRYLNSLYWAVTTLTTVGYGDISPSTEVEIIYAIVAMVVGGTFYGYLVATMSSYFLSMDATTAEVDDKIKLLKSYMKFRKFPKPLKLKVKAFFTHFYSKKSWFDENEFLGHMGTLLSTEVSQFLTSSLLGDRLLFQGVDEKTLRIILALLRPIHYKEKTIFEEAGKPAADAYLVIRGTVRIYEAETAASWADAQGGSKGESKIVPPAKIKKLDTLDTEVFLKGGGGRTVARFTDNQTFFEFSLLQQRMLHVHFAVAETDVEFYAINRDSFMAQLAGEEKLEKDLKMIWANIEGLECARTYVSCGQTLTRAQMPRGLPGSAKEAAPRDGDGNAGGIFMPIPTQQQQQQAGSKSALSEVDRAASSEVIRVSPGEIDYNAPRPTSPSKLSSSPNELVRPKPETDTADEKEMKTKMKTKMKKNNGVVPDLCGRPDALRALEERLEGRLKEEFTACQDRVEQRIRETLCSLSVKELSHLSGSGPQTESQT